MEDPKMKCQIRTTALAMAALAATTVLALVTAAQSQQSVYSPVILVTQTSPEVPTGTYQIREDGSGLQFLSIGGELSSRSSSGWRYFLQTVQVSSPYCPPTLSYPEGMGFDFVAIREDGDPLTVVPMTADPLVCRNSAKRWSNNGRRVVYNGTAIVFEPDENGELVTKRQPCIFVAEVAWSNGAPVGFTNERCAIRVDTVHPGEWSGDPNWSWDDLRITYSTELLGGPPAAASGWLRCR
jgi:hypothetical protein